MKRLLLTKGLSYSAMNFSCRKGSSFLVDDEMAEKLIATGRFEMLGVVNISSTAEGNGDSNKNQTLNNSMDDGLKPGKPGDETELTAELIEKMKKDELIALAAEKDIDIKDCKSNDDRIDRIKEALGLMNFGSLEFEEEE